MTRRAAAAATSEEPARSTRVDLTIKLSRFRLPPVESALVVGKRAVIGSNAMRKALDEMLPDQFTLVPIEHPVIEALLLRTAHLRRVPQERLVPLVVKHAEAAMDETDMMHVDLTIEIHVSETIEL